MPQKILMCAPDYFGVEYVINPWMEGHFHDIDPKLAARQWKNLYGHLALQAELIIMPSQPRLPDLVFTANAGLVRGRKAIVSRFRNAERQGEEPHFHKIFADQGFDLVDWPQNIPFEGAGDALVDRGRDLLWVGHGFRTDASVPALLEKTVGYTTVALMLIDPRFYHLDTCLCPLAGGYLLYFPGAFDAPSQVCIEAMVEANKRIAVSEDDALLFCCNAVDVNGHIYMNGASTDLQDNLRQRGFTPVIIPLSEFMKAGGAAKCLTLKLVED